MLEETNVTLQDTVFWACADSMMKSGHSSFLANCIGQYSRMASRLSVLNGGKVVEGHVTMLVHGSDPASALPERRNSRGRSIWMSEIGSPRTVLSSLHFLHAGHQGCAAAVATTATFISNSSHAQL